MKIWMLQVNQVATDSLGPIISSYRAPRTERKLEFYASREGAEKRRAEIYDGVQKLSGFTDGLEVVVSEIEVAS